MRAVKVALCVTATATCGKLPVIVDWAELTTWHKKKELQKYVWQFGRRSL